MKKNAISLIVVLLLFMFLLTGCARKTALTVNKFNEIAKKHDCLTEENLEFYDSFIDITEGSKAKYSDKWEVNFYVLSGNKDAEVMFEKQKNIAMSYEKSSYTLKNIIKMSNYETYQIEGNGHMAYLIRVDNTVLYVDCLDEYKEDVENFIKELGY